MRAALLTAVLLAVLSACPSKDAECSVNDDCWGSQAGQDLGRCGPQVACVEGVCEAWCPDQCVVTEARTNSCEEPGWICSDARVANGVVYPQCRATEIPCDSVDGCPKYLPSADGEWTCDDGICRFPGFRYLYED